MKSTLWRSAARCLVVFAAGASLAACIPGLPTLPAAAPVGPAPTLVELSTPTQVATNTLVLAVTASPTALATFTAIPSLTPSSTPTGIVTASLAVTGSPASTLTPTPPLTAQPTGTSVPFASFGLDKLPRGTTYKEVRILNRSHAQMDISLHCTTREGVEAILEYGNVRNLTVDAPEGNYVYVVYVGGRKIVGSFSLLHATSAVITVYKDHVTVR